MSIEKIMLTDGTCMLVDEEDYLELKSLLLVFLEGIVHLICVCVRQSEAKTNKRGVKRRPR